MKKISCYLLSALLCATSLASAHSKLNPATDASAHGIVNDKIDQTPVDAQEAVATVERFSAAIANAQFDKAAAELDANVLILESGGAEHGAAEYFSGHAKADADFLKTVHVVLKRRTTWISGDMASVASESDMHLQKDGNTSTILATETMVLKRDDGHWKIVHIHWSSHTKKP